MWRSCWMCHWFHFATSSAGSARGKSPEQRLQGSQVASLHLKANIEAESPLVANSVMMTITRRITARCHTLSSSIECGTTPAL